MEETNLPKVFISYSWEDDAHKQWVVDFAQRLRKDGIDVDMDTWGVKPAASLTLFMEKGIRDNEFVLLICTPEYKKKFDERLGGVGDEAEMITGEISTKKNREKYIPILRKGNRTESIPTWFLASAYVDLIVDAYSEDKYKTLLAHLHGKYQLPVPLGLPPEDLTPRQIDEAREKYLQYIIDTNQFVSSSVHRLAELKLDELYVTLTQRDSDTINIATALHDNTRAVILGDPGAGKTSLMRFLALHFAKAMQNTQEDVLDKENNNYGAALLPIFLRVAYFADVFAKNHSLTLKDYLLENCDGGDAEKPALKQLLSIALKEGKVLVLLDGLDEIVDDGDRAEIVRRIEQFVSSCNRDTHIVVTTRIAGYDDYPLRGGFVGFRLNDLGHPEIEKYLGRIQKEFGVETQKLLKAIDENPGASKLATNQLMLAIMIDAFEKDKVLSVRRVELYEKAINILVNEWQKKERGLSERVLESYEIIDLLAPLAYWARANKTNGLLNEKEVENKLAEFWAEQNDLKPSNFEVRKKVKEFFERAIDTGILVKSDGDGISFIHSTFQEYLAACDIVRRENETARLIYEHRHSARWEEIILLAIAYVSSSNPKRAEKLIREAVLAQDAADEGFYPSELEGTLYRDSLLAVRCISGCIGLSGGFFRQTITPLLNVYFDVDGAGKYVPLAERILRVMKDVGNSEVAGDAVQLLLNKLKNKENNKIRCIFALTSLGRNTKEIESALISCLHDKNEYVRGQSAEALGKLKLDSQESIRALLTALQDKEIDIRVKAAEALGELNNADEVIVNALLRILDGRGNEEIEGIIVIKAALIAIGKLSDGNSKIKDILFTLLSDEYIGKFAGETLGKFGKKDNEIVQGLINALQDKNWAVRGNAASAFQFLSDNFPTDEILKLLDSKSGYIRHGAILAIGESKVQSEQVVNALLSRLSDNEREVRKVAFEVLEQSQVTPELVVKYLEREVELRSSNSFVGLNGVLKKWARKNAYSVENGLLIGLHHKSDLVRFNSVQVLSALDEHSPQVYSELLNVLKNDQNEGVQFIVVAALGRIGHHSEELITGIVEKMKADRRNRDVSIWALERFGVKDTKIAQGLLFVLNDKEDAELTRKYAADALGNLGIDTYNVIEGLQEAIDSGSLHVEVQAAKALRKLGQKLTEDIVELIEIFPDKTEEQKGFFDFETYLMNRLTTETWSTRKEMSADFAGRINRERDYDLKWVYMQELADKGIMQPGVDIEIINGMKSRDHDLREASARTAGNLQVETSDVIQGLRNLLQDKDDLIRMCAVEALGKMEGKILGTWKGLIKGAVDESPSVRLYAIIGLGRLSGEQAKKFELKEKIKQTLVNALNDPRNIEIPSLAGFEHFRSVYHSAWEALLQVVSVS